MKDEALLPTSDFAKLCIADLKRVRIIRSDLDTSGRYTAHFNREDVEELFERFESGELKVSARDFYSAMGRTKTRIREAQRDMARK